MKVHPVSRKSSLTQSNTELTNFNKSCLFTTFKFNIVVKTEQIPFITCDGFEKTPHMPERWLSKNTDRQGVVFFVVRRHTTYVECRKKYHDAVNRSFYDAIICCIPCSTPARSHYAGPGWYPRKSEVFWRLSSFFQPDTRTYNHNHPSPVPHWW